MKKRVAALVLAFVLAMGLTGGLVFAADGEDSSDTVSGTCGDNLTWVLEDGVLTISGTGDMDDYGSNYYEEEQPPWYGERDEITSVVIESNVTSIGSSAFEECNNIESVSLPSALTNIGDYAFSYCISLESIEIPGSVTSIGTGAFYACRSVESIEIPEGVTSVGVGAFYACENLTSIEIPASVTSIGAAAFANEAVTSKSVIFKGDAPELNLPDGYGSFTRGEGFVIQYYSSIFGYNYYSTAADTTAYWPDVTIYYYSDAEGFTDEYKMQLEAGANVTWVVLDRESDETESAGSTDTGDSSDSDVGSDSADTGSTDTESDSSDTAETGSTSADDSSSDSTDTSASSDDSVSEDTDTADYSVSSGDGTDPDSAGDSASSDDSGSAGDTSLSIIDSATTASYTLGSGTAAVIAVDADIETFVSVTVDGTALTQDVDYTVTEGSTIITFTESFLETLSEGDHDVVIAFTGGDVETILSILSADASDDADTSDDADDSEDGDDSDDSEESSAAEVGDSSGLALWMALGLLAVLGLIGAGLRKRITG